MRDRLTSSIQVDEDTPHPSTHPMFQAAIAAWAIDNDKTPTLGEITATIGTLERQVMNPIETGSGKVGVLLFEKLLFSALGQAANTQSNVESLEAWIAVASKINREIDRCQNRAFKEQEIAAKRQTRHLEFTGYHPAHKW